MGRIFIKGREVLFDDTDSPLVLSRSWSLSHGYAVGWCKVEKKVTALHRILMGKAPSDGLQVDHINRDRLDNRRCNLRWVSQAQNLVNSGPKKATPKGVRSQSNGSFYAVFAGTYLGSFSTEKDAALAYDKAARDKYGEFAYLNYPDITDCSGLVRLPHVTDKPRSSGVVGVSFSHTRKAKAKWRATHKGVHLGWFETEIAAINCRKEAEQCK